jgi:tripartite-type tricarboxylate transporter receptor subunit TctC
MPLAAGSAVDVMVRLVADRMGEVLGQRLLIENVTGASGMIGMRTAARAAPDGYTLAAVNDAVLTMLPNMSDAAGYDPLRDFAPIGQVARIRWALAAASNLNLRDVAGLVAAARARQLDYASGGPGSPQHVAMEMFLQAAGVRMNHIGYRGATPALNAVAAGRCRSDFFGLPTPGALRGGGPRAHPGHRRPQRVETLRAVPTVAESGPAGLQLLHLGRLPGARRNARALRHAPHAALRESLATPALRERLEGLAFEVVGNTPEEFAQALARDHAAMASWSARPTSARSDASHGRPAEIRSAAPSRAADGGPRRRRPDHPARHATQRLRQMLNGITIFDPGAAIGEHFHNCEESVMVLEGAAGRRAGRRGASPWRR